MFRAGRSLLARVCSDSPLEVGRHAILGMTPAIVAEHIQRFLRPSHCREGAGEVAGGGGKIGVQGVGLLEMGKSRAEVPAPLEEDAQVLFHAGVIRVKSQGLAVLGFRLVEPADARESVAQGVVGRRVFG